jgi:serine protease inhibitor
MISFLESVKNAVMLMLNAIYFKGHWTKPFNEDATHENKFFLANNMPVNVQYMQQSATFFHENSEELRAQLLRVPFVGKRFAMFFVLPHEGVTLDQLLMKISTISSLLNIALYNMEPTNVNMTIPKFKFDFEANLNQPLEQLGIKDIFSNEASLPLLSRGQGTHNELKVSNVLQKAGIMVNEKGCEAFAATEVQLVNKIGNDLSATFVANRPFLFFVEDELHGTLLFAGKVENPLDHGV